MPLKLSILAKLVDKISGPAGKSAKGVNKLDGSMTHLERTHRRNKRLFKGRLYQAVGQSASRAGRKVKSFVRDLKLSERGMKLAKRAAGGLGRKLLSIAKTGLFVAGAAGGYALFDMFRVASDMEQYKIMLEGTEGSSLAAGRAMKWVRKFAETTPYELDQVMASYVQLRAYGIDPTTGSLQSLGDAASGMNKGLMQAVEALADAQTGEFERLKEFAIKTKSVGDSVTFSYISNGKTLTKTVKKDAAEIQKAVTGIFDERFGGGMERQSRSFKGLMSNLKDQWAKFQLMVADAGIFDKVKGGAQRLLEKVGQMAADGRLQLWAEKISDRLEKMWDIGVKFVEETDWQSVARGMGSIVTVVLKIIGLIGKAASAWSSWQKAVDQRQLAQIEGGWFISQDKKDAARKQYNDRYAPKQPRAAIPKKAYLKPSGAMRPLSSRSGSDRDVKVSGVTKVEIDVRGPAKARVKRVASNGSDVPMEVYLGKTTMAPL